MNQNSDPSSRGDVNRRSFLRAAVAGAALVPRLTHGAETANPTAPTGMFSEPGRDVPLVSDADVIVCGAGPAGVSAAITAARGGARRCRSGARSHRAAEYLIDQCHLQAVNIAGGILAWVQSGRDVVVGTEPT